MLVQLFYILRATPSVFLGWYSGFQVTGMIEWVRNSKPKKLPTASNNTPKNPSQKIFQRNYAARTYGNYHESSYCFAYPKKSLLKSSYPKKFLPKFPTQKKSQNRRFQSPKILQSSLSLEIQGSPLVTLRPDTRHLVCRLSEAGTKNITTLSCILFLQNAQL